MNSFILLQRILIILSSADVIDTRRHGNLIESLGKESVGFFIGHSGKNHDFGTGLKLRRENNFFSIKNIFNNKKETNKLVAMRP